MTHPLRCRCGAVRGSVAEPRRANRAVCYCKDCQAFAHFLGSPTEILDERGGSQVLQTLPSRVTFTAGADALACMRLTNKGMFRWYTACCRTPIGNTMGTRKVSFVGLLHTCLRDPQVPLDDSFNPIRAQINTHSAIGRLKPKAFGMAPTLWWLAVSITQARIDGSYKTTPFFQAGGAPVAAPQVLSSEELARLKQAVASAS